MNLYQTNLLIQGLVIPYQVYKEGDRLFFKPSKISRDVETPIFWASKTSGEWKPINIPDEDLAKQIQEDIAKHASEIGNL